LALGAALGCSASAADDTSDESLLRGRLPTSQACSVDVPRKTAVTVDVLPEAGEVPFTRVIDSAKSSVRVLMYMMGSDRSVLEHLVAKARAGVAVKVILDLGKKSYNQKAADALTAAGAEVIFSDPAFSYMHAKVIVADETAAAVSTGNPIQQLDEERNLVAHVTDRDDIATLLTVFDADFARRTPDLSCTRLLVSPVTSKPRIVALIETATKSLVIESMQLSDREVSDAVVARKNAGVAVRVILADPAWIGANPNVGASLKATGVDVRYLVSPAVHVKSMVVDGSSAYLGSENLSTTSLTKNREVGLVLVDRPAIKKMTDTFDLDWEAATPF
jgi:phosphatidylserine/phosphatidylglycerophosphate/cardiolipin synthase-like enzyme